MQLIPCNSHLVCDSEPYFTDKISNIAFLITNVSHSIMNAKLLRLSVNYGSVFTAAPSESRRWRFSANHGTGFTDEMHMRIACN